MPSIRKQLTPVRILYVGKALEGAAYSSCMPFLLVHFMKTLGLTAVASGFVLSAREMVPIFTALAMGWVVAKTSRKPVLVISLAALGVSILAFKTGFGGGSGLLAAALLSRVSPTAPIALGAALAALLLDRLFTSRVLLLARPFHPEAGWWLTMGGALACVIEAVVIAGPRQSDPYDAQRPRGGRHSVRRP